MERLVRSTLVFFGGISAIGLILFIFTGKTEFVLSVVWIVSTLITAPIVALDKDLSFPPMMGIAWFFIGALAPFQFLLGALSGVVFLIIHEF